MYYLVKTRTLFQTFVGRYEWEVQGSMNGRFWVVGSYGAGVRPCNWPNNVNIKLWYCVLLSDQLDAWEVHGGWVANITTDGTDTVCKYVDSAELSVVRFCAGGSESHKFITTRTRNYCWRLYLTCLAAPVSITV